MAMAAGAAALAAVTLLVWLSPEPGVAQEPDAEAHGLPVAVRSVVMESSYRVQEMHAGRVLARRESSLGFERSGRLDSIVAERGDEVTEGQELARLDTRELEARRRELEARVRQMEARLELARITERRRRTLRESDHTSIEALDQASTDASAFEAELAAARASLEQVAVAIDQSSIRAPYSGQIVERFEDEGTVVAPGQAILEIVESGALEVHLGVPPEAAARLVEGSVHRVEVNGRTHPARLDAVIRKLDTRTRTVPVVLLLEGSPEGVRSGDLARIALERDVQARGAWLPLTALAESRRGLWAAYVVRSSEEGDRVERREVEVLHAGPERAFVRGTLHDGERIVATGLHRLVQGQRVDVIGDGSGTWTADLDPVAIGTHPDASRLP